MYTRRVFEDEVDEVVTMFFEHQITMKMFHFQTNSGFKHTKVDLYLTQYALNFDRFMEVYQGGNSKIKTNRLTLEVTTVNDNNVVSHLQKMFLFLKSMVEISDDLKAIRDDMVSEINKLKYLLSFR